jgi:hypothetical protein
MVNIKSDWSSKQIKLSIIKIINLHVFCTGLCQEHSYQYGFILSCGS